MTSIQAKPIWGSDLTEIELLQAIFEDAARASGVIGAQVSVIQEGQRADFTFGLANLELGLPMTADTVIQAGSVTKVLNAALILSLVEEGHLSLETPVGEYVSDLRLSDKRAERVITLRHLLSMSSGLDNGPYTDEGYGADALGRYIASLASLPLAFSPGGGFSYSNAGASLAGYVAERVMGLRWDTLLRERILEPAGLGNALTLAEDLPFHRVSVGHAKATDRGPAAVIRPWYTTRAQGPSGSTLTISAADLAKFGELFVNAGRSRSGRRVLSAASVAAMTTPINDVPVRSPHMIIGQAWGLGPSMDVWDGAVVWGHSGGNRSGASRLIWFPELRAVLTLVHNTKDADDILARRILGDFCRAVFGAGMSLPVAPERPVPLIDLRRYTGEFERFGSRYVISEECGRLRYQEFNLGTGRAIAEDLGLMTDSWLVPTGQDRFLIESPGRGPLPVPLSMATAAFVGDAGDGRATHLLAPIFAARRTA